MENFFTIVFNLVGTFAFAVSGIRLASGKQVDWFGAYLIGLVTAVGGGTVRDLLLRLPPFWMRDGTYFLTTAVGLLAVLLFKARLFAWPNTLYVFDAVGLGLFTVVGISKSLAVGLPFWVCIVMGAITGAVGGLLRDVLLNEVPLLLRKDIYALASIAGGLGYYACVSLAFSVGVTHLAAALLVMATRLLAMHFGWQLPVLKPVLPENNP